MRKIALQLANAPVGFEGSNRDKRTKLCNAQQRLGRHRDSLRWTAGVFLATVGIGASSLATFTPMRRALSHMRMTAIHSAPSLFAGASSRPQSSNGAASSPPPLPVSSATPEATVQPIQGMTLNETNVQPVCPHKLVPAVQSAKSDGKGTGAVEAEARLPSRSLPIGSAPIPSNGSNTSKGSADAEFVNLTRR